MGKDSSTECAPALSFLREVRVAATALLVMQEMKRVLADDPDISDDGLEAVLEPLPRSINLKHSWWCSDS